MATESGGLSKEEFLLIQDQLLQLRNDNYELREELKKKNLQNSSPKSEALQFASKLINRAASSSKRDEKDAEIDGLRRKLETQEEEFRLQQETLFEEMKNLSIRNEQLKTQIATYSDHPLEKEAGNAETSRIDLENEIKMLKEEKELLCQETVPALNKKIANLKDELENCQTLNVELEDRVLTVTSEAEAIYNEKEVLDEENCRVMEEIEALRKENLEIVEEIQARNKEVVEENLKLNEERKSILEENLTMKQKLKLQNEGMEREVREKLTQKSEEIEKIQKELTESKENWEKEAKNFKNQVETLLEEVKLAKNYKSELEKSNSELKELNLKNQDNLKKIEDEKSKMQEDHENEISQFTAQLSSLKAENGKLAVEIEKITEESVKNQEKLVEDRILLLETRYQLEVDDQKKSFQAEKEEFHLKIASLEEKLKSNDEEKKISMKKHQAVVKELQKTLKEERKRADSYERKSEERAGWHVVPPESDRQSSHTFDGNESVSSLSAIESENVELITRLATLQKIHSENADSILQLESENSRLRREVTEKGELIESLIREKPLGFGNPNSPSFVAHPKLEVSFRKLLNTLSQDSSTSDVKEMNKKLQRMLEETLSKNIILQRDLQTLMERTGM